MGVVVAAAVLLAMSARLPPVNPLSARLGGEVSVLFGPLNGAHDLRDVRCHLDYDGDTRPPRKWAVSALLDAINATCAVPHLPHEAFLGRLPPRANLTLLYVRADDPSGTIHRLSGRRDRVVLTYLFPFSAPKRERAVVPDVLHVLHLGGAALPVWACLSLLTAALVWNPRHIVLHVDALPPEDDALRCARSLARVEMHAQPVRRNASAGAARVVPFAQLRADQRSDILRLDLLLERGGVAIEPDTFVLGSIDRLRRHDFSIAFRRAPLPTLENGMMLSAPRAPFAALLRDAFDRWRGEPWGRVSLELPFRLAMREPSLARIVNYPEARWPNGRKRPGTMAVLSVQTFAERGKLRDAYGDVALLHVPALGHAFSRKARERGDLLYALTHALAGMSDAPARLHARATDRRPDEARFARVAFAATRLLGAGAALPDEADLPARLSEHFPAHVANCTCLLYTSPSPRD